MANRLPPIFPQFFTSTPEVRSGHKLWFYAAGTETPLDTYSDKELVTLNANPVVLNSLGEPSSAIFLSNAGYKVKLKDENDVEIWSADDVFTSDYSTRAILRGYASNPNGAVAGTAASASLGADMIWDYTNSILYVATSTGTSSTTVWTAINSSSAAAIIPHPQGRLTLTSGTAVTTSDVTAATAVYYTPYLGTTVPLYSGTTFVPTLFSELTLNLVSSHAANTNYDLFVFSNAGVVVLVTGPAWSSGTSRGTGAGTTQLTAISGFQVNAVSMTARNGVTTYTVGANRGTYVGTVRTTGSNGTTEDSAANRYVWNAYNNFIPTTGLGLTGTTTPSGMIIVDGGTAAAPGLAFWGDLNSGVRRVGADNVALVAGGVDIVNALTTGAAITGTLSSTGVLSVTDATEAGSGSGSIVASGGGYFAKAIRTASATASTTTGTGSGIFGGGIGVAGAGNFGSTVTCTNLLLPASGAINWNSSDVLLTGTADLLTLTGGNFQVGANTGICNMTVSALNSGTSGGGFYQVDLGTHLCIIFGNKSAICGTAFGGGAYNATPYLYGTPTLELAVGNETYTTATSVITLSLTGGIDTGLATVNGALNVTSTTQATAFNNAAVTLAGGFGLAKDFFSTGKISCSSAQASGSEATFFNTSATAPTVLTLNASGVTGSTSHWLIVGNDSAANKFLVYSNGNVQNTNNSYGAISDAKVKRDIAPVESMRGKLIRLPVVNFNYKDDPKDMGSRTGCLSQDAEKVFPDLVSDCALPDGTVVKSFNYMGLVPRMLRGLQEMHDDIAALTAQLAAIKGDARL